MLMLREDLRVYLSTHPEDMRKAIDGLCGLVVDVIKQQPQTGHVFIFINKAKNKVKRLYWDRNGFVLLYKRLERGKFKIDRHLEGILELSQDQLRWLLAGLDFRLMNQFSELNYANYYY